MSHISYSVRRNPGGDPVATERRRRVGWLETSLAAVLLALPILPVMAADAPGVSVTVSHSFTGSDGASPFASLIQGPDGSLYGTTYSGSGNQGSVFKVNPDGTGFQALHTFSGADGGELYGDLVLLGGVLYGTTAYGSGSHGTVFKLNPDGTGFQTVHAFTGTDGSEPISGLTVVGGVLYGTTDYSYNGSNQGSVFKLNPDGTGFQTVHAFTGTDGADPYGDLVLLGGVLYGTTYEDYNGSSHGTVFKVNPDGTGFQTIHTFSGTDGGEPFAGLTAVGSVLYGTTTSGGTGSGSDGTVFSLNPDGTGFQTLHNFTGTNGNEPWGKMIQGADGRLYGTTQYSDNYNGNGTVFSINPDGTDFQHLHDFNGSDGANPWAGLIQGIDGDFYGTASGGGTNGNGTVFHMRLGPVTTASLSGTQGAHGWYTGDVTVTLTAADPVAAITNTYYSVDGGAQQIYTAPFVVSGDLAHTVVFHSEDTHGTVEDDETQAVNIDGTLPTLTFGAPDHAANTAGWNNTALSIPYTAADDTSGVDTPGTSGSVMFSTEGANQTQTVTVTDVAGNAYSLATSPVLNIDLTAPVTTGALSGATAQSGDYTGTATVTLTPTDNLSGVDSTVYAIDGGADQPYTVPFTVPGDGAHTVTFHSVDVAGNVETTQTLILTADATAPVTTASLSGPQGAHSWYTSDVTVTLDATDLGSGVASTVYSIDGGTDQPYTVPFIVSGDARHTVTFHSVDADGNVEADQLQSVRIDGTSPTLTFGTPSPTANTSGWNNTDVTYPYTATDATSGFSGQGPSERHPNRPAPQTLNGSATVTGEGTALTQTATVTDIAGNSAAFTTPPVNIDRTKPVTIAATQSGAAGQTVTLTATDNLSGVASTVYSIDGGADQPYTAPFTLSGNGDHVVIFHSVDTAGNIEDAAQVSFTVNIAAPITTASLSGTQGDNGWYPGDVTVTLAAQAASVAIGSTFYTVDGGTQQTYTGPFTVSGDAVHTVTYWSVDTAGNAEAQNQLPVKIDGTAPTLTVGIASPAPNAAGWNNSPVTVAVSGTDATSGLAALNPGGSVTFSTAGNDQTQTVAGKDNAGNTASVSTPKVNIDLTTPTTTATPSGSVNGDGSYTTSATVTLSASDDLSGVASTTYSVDGGTAKPYTDPFTVSGTGTHTVTFSSVDVAGNAESSKTLTVTVAAPPTPVLHTFGAGLQMIAVPEDYTSAATAFSLPVNKVAIWSPRLVQYTLQDGSAALHPGQGYWVRLAQSTDLYDTGTPTPTAQPLAVSLQKGWNMIGDPFQSAVSLSAVTVSSSAGKSFSVKDANLAGLLSVTLYSYPAGSSAYQATGLDGSLAPYTGYWIYAFQPCSLSLPTPTAP